MSLLTPLVTIAGESLGKTIDKLNFKRNNIEPASLIFLIFSSMLLCLLVLIFFTKPSLPQFGFEIIGLILLMILVSLGQNIFDFTGLKYKDLSFREPIYNFQPIMAGFIAFLVFPSERDIVILFAIVVGALILYIGNNGTKLRLKFDKGALFILCAMMCSSILVNIYKFGLEHIEPAYLFLFRVCGILVFIPIIQNVHFSKMRAPHIRYGLSSGCVYFCSFFFKLISIATLGLNATILVLLFGPVCTYFLSSFVLKEEITLRKIVMSVLLIFIIVGAFYL